MLNSLPYAVYAHTTHPCLRAATAEKDLIIREISSRSSAFHLLAMKVGNVFLPYDRYKPVPISWMPMLNEIIQQLYSESMLFTLIVRPVPNYELRIVSRMVYSYYWDFYFS